MQVRNEIGALITAPDNVAVLIYDVSNCCTPELILVDNACELIQDDATPYSLGLWCYTWTPEMEGEYLIYMLEDTGESTPSLDLENSTFCTICVLISYNPIVDTEMKRERNYFATNEISTAERFVPKDKVSHVHVQIKAVSDPEDWSADPRKTYFVWFYYNDETPNDIPNKMSKRENAPTDGIFYLKHPESGEPW